MLDTNCLQRSLKGGSSIQVVSRQMLVDQPDQHQANFFRIIVFVYLSKLYCIAN
jgi:hypothetical protein